MLNARGARGGHDGFRRLRERATFKNYAIPNLSNRDRRPRPIFVSGTNRSSLRVGLTFPKGGYIEESVDDDDEGR